MVHVVHAVDVAYAIYVVYAVDVVYAKHVVYAIYAIYVVYAVRSLENESCPNNSALGKENLRSARRISSAAKTVFF